MSGRFSNPCLSLLALRRVWTTALNVSLSHDAALEKPASFGTGSTEDGDVMVSRIGEVRAGSGTSLDNRAFSSVGEFGLLLGPAILMRSDKASQVLRPDCYH